MRPLGLLSLLALCCVAEAQQSAPLVVEWNAVTTLNRAEKLRSLGTVVRSEESGTVLEVRSQPVKDAPWHAKASAPALAVCRVDGIGSDSEGLSFEVKGDGSEHYASVCVSETKDAMSGYEAVFPLRSTQWQTVTLRWRDFVRNDVPWNANARLNVNDMAVSPTAIRFIGYGQGQCHFKFYAPSLSFDIRNIRVVSGLPDDPVPSYSKGLARTRTLLQRKKPLNILLLGDSITDLGGDKSYGWHCAKLLREKAGVACQVANAGIGGHTARHGMIVLPRSMLSMPEPDLVCIMYGANDCKAANPPYQKTGFGEAAFAKNLEALVDQVRRLTRGQADVMLLSGVPRLDTPGGTTSGAVEAIVGAVRRVASEKETAFCDTFPAFLLLNAAEKQEFYMDTIHQTQAGLEFIGKLVYESLAAP